MQMLYLANATGELRLQCEENSASVFFERGNLTFAGIKNRPVKLGEYLVKKGLVPQAALDDALARRSSSKIRIGALLVEAGHIAESGLRAAVVEQIKDVIFEIVRWQSGTFCFYLDKRPLPAEILIDIPLDHLMLEGVQRLDEEREHRS